MAINVFVPYLYKIILLLENDENKEKESYFSIENVENTKLLQLILNHQGCVRLAL